MLVSWPSGFVLNKDVAAEYARQVEAASDGRIVIDLYGPDVIPPFEQLSPVQDGVFHLIATHPSYHSGTVGAAMSIDGVKPGAALRRETGAWAIYDDLYREYGLKLLAAPQLGERGLQFILKEPLDPESALDGKIVRGTAPYHHLIRELGGAPVVLSGAELYSGLERGIIDGVGFALFGVPSLRLHEVATYLVRPGYGSVCNLVLINLKTWEGLSSDDQALLLAVGEAFEKESKERLDRIIADDEALLLSSGMEISHAPADIADEFDRLWSEGSWSAAEALQPKKAAALKQKLSDIGMLITSGDAGVND